MAGCAKGKEKVHYLAKAKQRTHFLKVEPTLVTNPLTLSDRREESTKVEPGSFGASRATHSSRPSFSEANDSCSDSRSHWSSRD